MVGLDERVAERLSGLRGTRSRGPISSRATRTHRLTSSRVAQEGILTGAPRTSQAVVGRRRPHCNGNLSRAGGSSRRAPPSPASEKRRGVAKTYVITAIQFLGTLPEALATFGPPLRKLGRGHLGHRPSREPLQRTLLSSSRQWNIWIPRLVQDCPALHLNTSRVNTVLAIARCTTAPRNCEFSSGFRLDCLAGSSGTEVTPDQEARPDSKIGQFTA